MDAVRVQKVASRLNAPHAVADVCDEGAVQQVPQALVVRVDKF